MKGMAPDGQIEPKAFHRLSPAIRPSSRALNAVAICAGGRAALPDSVVSVKVTAEAARRFLVARQLLAPLRSVEGGPDAVLEVSRRLGSVQFDPLAVAGRNHDLVEARGPFLTSTP
jgi:hypothetical protein